MTRPARLALVALLLVASAGCRLRVDVAVDVEEDGGGTVEVGVGLDDDAIGRLPDVDRDGERAVADLVALVAVDDLEQDGWEVTGPVVEDDGLTWMRARKPFASPDDAARVLAEVAGDDGPFRDFAVSREPSFAQTRYAFDGTVDFGAGIDDTLDRAAVGDDVATIEERLGTTLDRVVGVRVAVRLPGDVESNAPTRAANGAVWTPRFGEGAVQLEASSEIGHTGRLALVTAAGLAVIVAFGLVVGRRVVARRRTAR